MIDEPNSHNQHHHEDQGADTLPLLEEVDALARRLLADGDLWRRRLPDSARLIERIRAIPHQTLLSASEADFPMLEDDGSSSGNTLPVVPRHPPRQPSFLSRLGNLAAVAVVLALIGSVAVVFYSARRTDGSGGGVSTHSATSIATAASAVFQVSSVDMSVKPASITGTTCGTTVTVTYTAVFHAPSHTQGGVVQFTYTVNNGRGQNPASVTFAPGQTSQSYSFTWSGALPGDHTYPEPGGVQVTSPNYVTSTLVVPTGQCTPPAPPVCGSNFSSPISQSYQNTLSTTYGTVPLPLLSRTVPNNASGGVRGYDICSAGTASTVISYMEQNLPLYGWTLVSKSGGMESWKNSNGTINWSVTDPLEWNINWRVPLT